MVLSVFAFDMLVRINCEEGKTQAINKVMAQVQLAQCIERSIEISKS